MRDHGMLLTPDQQRSLLTPCDQTGQVFKITHNLPRGIDRVWTGKILGTSPRSTRRDNVDIVWVEITDEKLAGKVPEYWTPSSLPMVLSFNKEEIAAAGIAIA